MPKPSFVESLEARRLLSTVLSSIGAQPTGPLTGKIVYTSGGHGFTSNTSGVWSTGRGETNEMVEDMGNIDQMSLYADALWRAGATVVPMRPVGHQTNEAIVDNLNASYSGTWSDSAGAPFFSTSDGAGVSYRYASTSLTETAVATYAPTIPETGFYPVYTWVRDGTDRAADQLYRINHAGGSTEVKVNHQRVGKGWVYLGTYSFRAGQSGSVQISNKSATTGKVVIADAIRFGNGMGDIARSGTLTSGLAREDEAALYWVEASAGWTGVGTRVSYTNWRSSLSSTDNDANVSAPLRWAEYMNAAPFGQSIYLSFHSNAGGGRGADGLYNNETLFPGTSTPNQFALADLVGTEITEDMFALGSPPLEYAWSYTSNPTFARSDYAFGEIRGDTSGYEFDATIIEVAFHDNASDAAIMRDPVARERIAQSTTQATIRYFNTYGGGSLAFAPDSPTNLRTSTDASGNLVLTWNASVTSPIFGGAATGYRVYASRDGYAFDGGTATTGTTLTIPRAQVGSGVVYFKVMGVNAGGESPASSVVAARLGSAMTGRVLIVDGFDRHGRAQNYVQSVALSGTNVTGPKTTLNTIDRVRPRYSNSGDYAVQHAQAIAGHPSDVGIDTVDHLAVINGQVSLGNYKAVVWILGEESSAERTFDATEQSRVSTYLNGGGKLFVSGSEIGWDLVARSGGASFMTGTLRSNYAADDANTYAATGVAGSIFNGLSLGFDNGSGAGETGTYNVDYPDRLSTTGGSVGVLNYSGGTGGTAATYWAGTNGAATLVMGFPFETITDAGVRASLMRRALDAFGFNGIAPAPTPLPAALPAVSSVASKRKPAGLVASDLFATNNPIA